MKNLNVTIAAIIIALFALTSCQKENVADLASIEQTTTTSTERNLPDGGISIVNDEVKTEGSKDRLANKSTSRSREITWINAEYETIHGTTIREGNSLDRGSYPSCAAQPTGDTFEGNDKIYYFEIDRDLAGSHVTHYFDLTNLTADLDLFLFALDRYNRISACKAISITGGLQDEQITVSGLNEGAYILVVDGYMAGIEGNFTLDKNYAMVSPNPPSIDPSGPISNPNPPAAAPNSMKNAKFIEFVNGHAGITGDGWLVVRNGETQLYDDAYTQVQVTDDVLTLKSKVTEYGKTTEMEVTFDRKAKWATSKTKVKEGYSTRSSFWSASITDIDFGN